MRADRGRSRRAPSDAISSVPWLRWSIVSLSFSDSLLGALGRLALGARRDRPPRRATAASGSRASSDEQWQEHLQALTGDALQASSSSLLELAESRLRPISETLDRFEPQATALEERRLLEVVGDPAAAADGRREGQERLRRETGNLVTALRAPHVRGRWGEMQLKRVVELAGMLDHCDFVEQASERDDDGRLLRPDLVVKLAGRQERRRRRQDAARRLPRRARRPTTTRRGARTSSGTPASCAST